MAKVLPTVEIRRCDMCGDKYDKNKNKIEFLCRRGNTFYCRYHVYHYKNTEKKYCGCDYEECGEECEYLPNKRCEACQKYVMNNGHDCRDDIVNCEYCDYSGKRSGIGRHENKHKCSVCNEKFKNMVEHMSSNCYCDDCTTWGKCIHWCDFCNKRVDIKEHSKTPCKCPYCDLFQKCEHYCNTCLKFNDKETHKNTECYCHVCKDYMLRCYQHYCGVCKRTFEDYKNHEHYCDICNKNNFYGSHKHQCGAYDKFNRCNTIFQNNEEIKNHKCNLTCSECGKKYHTLTFTEHMLEHTEMRGLRKCKVCEMTIPKYLRDYHMKIFHQK